MLRPVPSSGSSSPNPMRSKSTRRASVYPLVCRRSGRRQQTVQTGLSQATGLDAGKTGQLLTMLAPLVMGALGKAKRENQLDSNGLSTMLTGEQERLREQSPGVMGALSRFLDQDNDGNVMDDVGGMLGKAFGGGKR